MNIQPHESDMDDPIINLHNQRVDLQKVNLELLKQKQELLDIIKQIFESFGYFAEELVPLMEKVIKKYETK